MVPKPEGDGGDIFPPIIWLHPPNIRMVHFCIPPNNLKECTVQLSLNLGKKVFFSCWRPFLFGLHLNSGRKSVLFALFFWSSQNFHTCTKSWSRFIPPMLKIGQNWGKIANYPLPMLNKDRHHCACNVWWLNQIVFRFLFVGVWFLVWPIRFRSEVKCCYRYLRSLFAECQLLL